jgi:hypothetical protein
MTRQDVLRASLALAVIREAELKILEYRKGVERYDELVRLCERDIVESNDTLAELGVKP